MRAAFARELLQRFFAHAVASVSGDVAMARALRRRGGIAPDSPVAVLAIGKAADSMCRGALDVLGDAVQTGLLITKQGHLSTRVRTDPRLHSIESAHPLPDQRSLDAGVALTRFLDELPAGLPLLVMLSGGASSLVEELPDGFGVESLTGMNRWLLSRDLPIDRVNAVRRSVSCIKGGRLRSRLGDRSLHVYLISDVPGDDPSVIGSGLLFPSADEQPLPDDLPAEVGAMAAAAPPQPRETDLRHLATDWQIVASNRLAREAVVRLARREGLQVWHHRELIEGNTATAGRDIVRRLAQGEAGLHVFGGETTVSLPPDPGRGGRAQALALQAALELDGGTDIALLAAGTDGTDGPGEDAGAVVDGDTCARGRAAGLDPLVSLEAADSGSFLAASGDLIRTGPTGTNVMDLYLGFRS